ncbi:hypothetical protein HN51_042985 [Arachis hypogaea]
MNWSREASRTMTSLEEASSNVTRGREWLGGQRRRRSTPSRGEANSSKQAFVRRREEEDREEASNLPRAAFTGGDNSPRRRVQ